MINQLKLFLHNQISAFSTNLFGEYPPPEFTMHLDDFVEGIRHGRVTLSGDWGAVQRGSFSLSEFDIHTAKMVKHRRKMKELTARSTLMRDTSRALDTIVDAVFPLILGDGQKTLLSMLSPEHRTRVLDSIKLLGDTLYSTEDSRVGLLSMLTGEHYDTMSKFLDQITYEKEEIPSMVDKHIKQ